MIEEIRRRVEEDYVTIPQPDVRLRLSDAKVLLMEIDRLSAGLKVIIEGGAIWGPGWCIAQARGYLEDLDFDAYPETGKEPR